MVGGPGEDVAPPSELADFAKARSATAAPSDQG